MIHSVSRRVRGSKCHLPPTINAALHAVHSICSRVQMRSRSYLPLVACSSDSAVVSPTFLRLAVLGGGGRGGGAPLLDFELSDALPLRLRLPRRLNLLYSEIIIGKSLTNATSDEIRDKTNDTRLDKWLQKCLLAKLAGTCSCANVILQAYLNLSKVGENFFASGSGR